MFDDAALPFSQACERNKEPIANALAPLIRAGDRILEVGSGTGQHVCHLAAAFPDAIWQPSDVNPERSGVTVRAQYATEENVLAPLTLRVGDPVGSRYQGIFTANSLHIMDHDSAANFFVWARPHVRENGWIAVYGPFNDGGKFTSEGNRSLDAWARANFPGAGIRDIQDVSNWANNAGFAVVSTTAMPANNLFLEFRA